ncbi:MAG TPA: phosphoribosylamine--glycine ligase [Sphingorhabdus sp.]|uniref:phosphoribosylamine--glycine ligase n=1 Tax=Sphingorhabdus sp. TaxID=1902408 RepID=UPI002BC9225E|nr:phosphoribosylamine--glycine ligase [Sphingorhabdus sp.]HMT40650.1 phosphoribosylamine--glycine ligase [Sphingorhabdus sp.]HMU22252.1 phosphoribosylamine--glycine ligase [Sphingorhabdus sp.]
MNILLIGSGGREHALAWRLSQSPLCEKLFASPGNPGIAECAECVDVDPTDHEAVIAFCAAKHIEFVVVGPEAPLVDGLGDSLRAACIKVFGPNANAAVLEGSKGFVKDLCARENIPTAAYSRHTDKSAALADLPRFGLPVVIKADGLAAGKGVIIAETESEAREAIEHMFGGGFGDAGAEVVIEEFMTGEEVSFFAISDGQNVVPFGSAQDHKRVGDGDTGPNTGGMGAYSPAPVFTPELEADVMDRIIQPTVKAMARDRRPYSGVFFAGLMLTAQGPKLIEYNCRFGDPECQVLMMRFEGDLVELLIAAATEGGLAAAARPVLSDKYALTVVMAANGYPGTPEKGGAITIGNVGAARIFHAGTAMKGDQLVANGGRVLNVTATGASVTEAQAAAYTAVDAINFPTGFARRDIGWREIEREKSQS